MSSFGTASSEQYSYGFLTRYTNGDGASVVNAWLKHNEKNLTRCEISHAPSRSVTEPTRGRKFTLFYLDSAGPEVRNHVTAHGARRVIFSGVRIRLGTILGRFSIIYFRGLGLRFMLGLGLWLWLGLGLGLGLVWCYGQGKFRVRV